jgi:glycosyltransferase involved in cell wall biosynthesis
MRIAVDGRTIVAQRTGVGAYAERLMRALLRIDETNEYTVFLVEPNDQLRAPNLRVEMITGYDRAVRNRWWENVLLPRYLRRQRIDLFFSPAYALPIKRTRQGAGGQVVRYVTTIHDLVAFTHPHSFTAKMRLWQRVFVHNAARVADRIICVSEATKDDLLAHASVQPERVSVVPNAVDETFRPIYDENLLGRVRQRYDLPARFILFVGTLEPRKNVVALARSYATLPGNLRDTFSLVLAGGAGWYHRTIVDDIRRLAMGDRVRFIGFVEHQDLPALYNLSDLFVYPSLYEGFGYPPLEAMACGVPVITSDRSSMPEVAGAAALLVNPHDVGAIAQGMHRLLVNDVLRKEYRAKGIARAAQFNWQRNARETLAVLEDAVRG